MSVWGELLVALAILVGLLGVIVPILPGILLVFGAILVWAIFENTAFGWGAFALATIFLVVSGIIKYTWPGKNLKAAGVANRSILIGGVLGIVGFFVVPVLGLFLGFLLGCYLSELQRTTDQKQAWTATVHALKAVGLSILVELAGGLLAASVWLVAAVFG